MSADPNAAQRAEIEKLRLDVEREHLELERANLRLIRRMDSSFYVWLDVVAKLAVVAALVVAIAIILAP